MLPCPDCGQRVVLPGVGVEAHVCADPAAIRAFFDALGAGEKPAPVASAVDGAPVLAALRELE